jgi:hypothetical protein
LPRPQPPARKPPPRPALIGWFAAMGVGGFAFGLIADARPFGDDVLAHPLVVFFLLVCLGLLVLRLALARPVPDVLPERVLLMGTFLGLGTFLFGNFVTVHLLALAR